jgi:hypothetical protein
MTRVEDHLVLGRVEGPVHRDGELDDAEVGAEVPARPRRRGLHEDVADLAGQHAQLVLGELL